MDDAEKAVQEGLEFVLRKLRKTIANESLHLLDRNGQASATASTDFTNFIESLMSTVLPSLNHVATGVIVPVFGEPGGNPDDSGGQFDFFWQHHLGHYYEYLKAQYGP